MRSESRKLPNLFCLLSVLVYGLFFSCAPSTTLVIDASSLEGNPARAQAQVVLENRLGKSFRLTAVRLSLDEAVICSRADSEGQSSLADLAQDWTLFRGPVAASEHCLEVNLDLRGHGYGVFSYLKKYKFKVRSEHCFDAPGGKRVIVKVIATERGDANTPLDERPAVRFEVRTSGITQKNKRTVD